MIQFRATERETAIYDQSARFHGQSRSVWIREALREKAIVDYRKFVKSRKSAPAAGPEAAEERHQRN